MAWRTTDPAVRYGVYMAQGRRCHWCPEPLGWRSLTIDHLVAETTDLADLPRIIAEYALPDDFALEDFRNWVPAHLSCNSSKGKVLYASGGAMIKMLHDVGNRAEKAKGLAEGYHDAIEGAKTLLDLEQALESERVSTDEAQELIHRFQTDESGWRVITCRDGEETVTNGRVVATRPAPGNDAVSWICGTCHERGPWQGAICTNCGVRSTPD